MHRTRALALTQGFALLYLAIFPGSLLTLALDLVPESGRWMGSALLLVQGAAALGWLAGVYGWRGLTLAGGLLALGWGAELLGISTGFPFGSYGYTAVLQPQLAGVPLPIAAAWLMAGLGAWQLAQVVRIPGRAQPWVVLLTATLVTVLDLQLETVATHLNGYWLWASGGPYYGVPTANFLAWWLLGAVMALALERLERGQWLREPAVLQPTTARLARLPRLAALGWRGLMVLPGLLFLASSLMFTAVNAARGYPLAALTGIVFLLIAALSAARGGAGRVAAPAFGRSADRSPADRA